MNKLNRRTLMKGAVVAGAVAAIGADGKPIEAAGILQGEPAAYFGPEHCANTCGKGADFVYDATGDCFQAGCTEMTGANLIHGLQVMGDHKVAVEFMAMHSVVHARMQINNLIDWSNASAHDLGFGTFLGKAIMVSDDLRVKDNVYETWLFGNGVSPGRLARESTRNIRPEVLRIVKNWSHIMTGNNKMPHAARVAHYNAHPNCKECFYVKVLTREA